MPTVGTEKLNQPKPILSSESSWNDHVNDKPEAMLDLCGEIVASKLT